MKTIFFIVILTLLIYLLAVYFYKRRLTGIRDNADFTTVRGKALIKACNEKLDFINGYGIFKRRSNKADT